MTKKEAPVPHALRYGRHWSLRLRRDPKNPDEAGDQNGDPEESVESHTPLKGLVIEPLERVAREIDYRVQKSHRLPRFRS